MLWLFLCLVFNISSISFTLFSFQF